MKNILIYIVIIISLVLSIYLGINMNKNKSNSNTIKDKSTNIKVDEDERLSELDYINKKVDYFSDEYIDRYIAYHKSNPDTSLKDVITRVNLNLDKDYYTDTKKSPYLNKYYILTNKYIYMGEDYIPDNLVSLDTSYSRSGMMLVRVAKDAIEEMIKSAKSDGYNIRVMSSYRSYKYQVNLYNRYKESDGEKAADTYSARPGYSEHQTGLCVDIDDGVINYTDFEKSKSFKWMQENAYKYGFVLRYPEDKTEITGYTYESWHYRYVGKEIAEYIKKHNITFDEYYVMFIENKK